mmetsp:Transcript_83878/g.234070  ORF Transcript_83878/g.234070 Transcript_83878/m.234070 type:complete len:203 (+) Transcript_83878:836-1444(+)
MSWAANSLFFTSCGCEPMVRSLWPDGMEACGRNTSRHWSSATGVAATIHLRYSTMPDTHRSLPPQPRDLARSLPVPRGTMPTGTRSKKPSRPSHCSSAVRIHVTVPSPPQTRRRLSTPSSSLIAVAKSEIVLFGSSGKLTSHTSPNSALPSSSILPRLSSRAFMIDAPAWPPLREFTNATMYRSCVLYSFTDFAYDFNFVSC